MWYRLDIDNNIVKCRNFDEFVTIEGDKPSKRIKSQMLHGAHISTVFLSLDHGYNTELPVLFETMVFWNWERGQEYDEQYQDRCCTYDESLEMHEKAVRWVETQVEIAILEAQIQVTWRKIDEKISNKRK